MQIRNIFILIPALLMGCKETDAQKSREVSSDTTTKQTEAPVKEDNYWQKLVMYEMKDAKGIVTAVMPVPETWTSATLPNGLKMMSGPSQAFIYMKDPSMQYAYQASGMQMRSYPGTEAVVQQDFIPWGNSQGFQYVKHYELPEIAKVDQWYVDQLYQVAPRENICRVLGIEYKDKSGKPQFIVARISIMNSGDMQNWSYYCSHITSDTDAFELIKKQYIFSLSNMRYSLEPIMAYNRAEMEKEGRSWQQFNARMAANQAAFDAQQRAHVNKSEAINNAIMGAYNSRNATSDKIQGRFIDAIREETNVVNTSSGTVYKVAEGANHYWMNSDGDYFGTQKQDYNPNLDESVNRQKWEELKRIKN